MIPRIRPIDVLRAKPLPRRFVADLRWIDITSTLLAAIRNAPRGMVACSIRTEAAYPAGALRALERAARRRGARIIWLAPGRAVTGGNNG